MEVIYFYGWDMNPVIDPVHAFYSEKTTIIRIYDHAGNLLNSIQEPVRIYFDSGGNQRWAYEYPWSLAADRSGRIYCAMQIVDPATSTGDQFRVYQRDGYRVEWPDLGLTQTVYAVAVDHDSGAVYVGATEEPDHTCLHKYSSDGTPVWSIAMTSGSFQAYTGPLGGNKTVNTTCTILKIEVQANGDLVVLGSILATNQSDVPGVGVNGEFIRRYSSGGTLLYTVKTNNALDFSLSDSGELFIAARPIYLYTYDINGYSSESSSGGTEYHNDYLYVVPSDTNFAYNFIKFDSSWQFVGGARVPGYRYFANLDPLFRARWYDNKVFCPAWEGSTNPYQMHVFDDDLNFIETRAISDNDTYSSLPPGYYEKSEKYGMNNFIIDRENGRFYFPGGRYQVPLRDTNGDPHLFATAGNFSVNRAIFGLYHFLVLNNNWEPEWTEKNASGAPGVDRINQPWSEIFAPGVVSVGNNLTLETIHAQYNNVPDFVWWKVSGEFWNFYHLNNYREKFAKTDFTYVVHGTEVPPIAIPIGLAEPSTLGDRYVIAPALPFPISVGLPAPIRFLRPGLPVIYLLRVTGDTTDLELKLSSLQIRRTLQATTADLVSPEYQLETVQSLIARKTAGAELVVLHGVRLPGIPDQIDELFRVSFDSLRWDRGGNSAKISLSGSAAYMPSAYSHRLEDITYRAVQSGKRRVRCRVNTYLRPGNTALLPGSESLVVGEITIFVAAGQAQMDIAEI